MSLSIIHATVNKPVALGRYPASELGNPRQTAADYQWARKLTASPQPQEAPVESIYFVMSWVCHRTCEHCYEDRFHPYHGEELQRLVRQSQDNVPRIIDNLPSRMTYLDLADPDENGNFREKRGRIIVAGGEILLDAVRESVLYPALEQLRRKYGNGVELIVQTTGDILTEKHIIEMLDRGVSVISVSGMDAYHEGFETEQAREKLRDKLTQLFL